MYMQISRSKGCRGNYAGDGPSRNMSAVRLSLEKNDIYIRKLNTSASYTGNYKYYISEILHFVFERKFGSANVPLVGCLVLELNNQNINLYNRQYVKFLLTQHDVNQIKFLPLESQQAITLNAVENQDVREAISGVSYNFNRTFEIQSPSSLKSLHLKWDFDKPCRFCGCILYFTDEPVASRKKCCNNGKVFLQNSEFPLLQSLPPEVFRLCTTRNDHMGRNSVSYNYVLSLGSTGVENETGEGGFETIHGDYSFLLHGRMYHCLPHHESRTGGLYFFTYDAIHRTCTPTSRSAY